MTFSTSTISHLRNLRRLNLYRRQLRRLQYQLFSIYNVCVASTIYSIRFSDFTLQHSQHQASYMQSHVASSHHHKSFRIHRMIYELSPCSPQQQRHLRFDDHRSPFINYVQHKCSDAPSIASLTALSEPHIKTIAMREPTNNYIHVHFANFDQPYPSTLSVRGEDRRHPHSRHSRSRDPSFGHFQPGTPLPQPLLFA